MSARRPVRKIHPGLVVMQAVVLIGAGIILWPQAAYLYRHAGQLAAIDWWWLSIAVWGSLLSYIMAGYVYYFLVDRPLPVWPTILVQAASAFTSRLLPGGAGNISVNLQYFRRQGYTGPQATVIAVSNQIIGLFAYLAVAAATIAFGGVSLAALAPALRWWHWPLLSILLLTVVYVFQLLTAQFRGKVRVFAQSAFRSLKELSRQPLRLIAAVAVSAGITLAYGLCMYASVRATGADLDFARALLVFVAAGALGSAAPTPGGLGAVEAAVAAGLAAMGLDGGTALLATFVFRLATFWLPIPPGYFAFRVLLARRYI